MREVDAQPATTDLVAHITSTLFGALDEPTLRALETELESVHLAEGEILCRQGEAGDSMYVLVHGRLSVTIQHPDGSRVVVGELGPGDCVGEMALLTGQARAATVQALEDAELVRLSRAGFDRIAERHPQIITEFAHAISPRWRGAQLAGVLANLCGEMDAATFHDLQARLEWRHLAAGETLFREGEPGDAMYIVVAGRLSFVVEDAGGDVLVRGEVGPGEVVGEFALLTGEPRSATVYAIRDTDLVRLSQPVFEDLVRQYPRVMLHLARNIIKHGRQAIRASAPTEVRATTIAVVPTSRSVPLADFALRLVEALTAFGPTLHLSGERFDRCYGKAGAAQTAEDHPTSIAITAWLSERETQYRYIVYETDATWSPWTRRCLRQADRLLFVGEAGTDPAPGEIEVAGPLKAMGLRRELVLLQPEGIERPSGTAEWLAQRHVQAHYHVRLKVQADFQHLARRLTGRAVGLVLSGGGARGMAHVGTIRALEEAGLPIDFVGGTSIGAVIGAGYAMGWNYRELVERVRSFSSTRVLLDRTLPLVSLFASKKLTQVLRTLFQEVQIEDLWRPYFCISCNVTQGREVVHREGALWKAVRASVAIPGVFSPILDDGDVLVDGGVINNFPIDVMRDLCGNGIVIGVNASPTRHRHREYRFGPSISGWWVLWRRLNPFTPAPPVPSIVGSLMRVLGVNSLYRERAVRHLADLLIQPSVEGVGILEFDSYPEIIEIGYQAARQALAAWMSGMSMVEGTQGGISS